MPYFLIGLGFLAFFVAGIVATALSLFFDPIRRFQPYIWRVWLFGSLGFVLANALLTAALYPFMTHLGVSRGSATSSGILTYIVGFAVFAGPFIASVVGLLRYFPREERVASLGRCDENVKLIVNLIKLILALSVATTVVALGVAAFVVLSVWGTMLWVGSHAMSSAPGHGAAVVLGSGAIAAILGLVALPLLTMYLYDRLSRLRFNIR